MAKAHRRPIVETDGAQTDLRVGRAKGDRVPAFESENPTAEAQARCLGVSDRFEFISGDFFEEVPGSDLFLLKNVLGNWDYERWLTILDNSRRHAHPGSRWVIVENAIDESRPGRWAVDVDIVTLVAVGGRVRSVDEYQRLLTRAGLQLVRNTPATAGYELIEAVLR